MALKEYYWRGHTWQFDEADAPSDAVLKAPEKAAKPTSNKKASMPANKARTPRTKQSAKKGA